MISFAFSAEAIKSAPPDVRHWMESQIIKALNPEKALVEGPAYVGTKPLAECGADEAAEIFRLISRMLPVAQVFFELGRESRFALDAPPLHCLSLEEIQRHVQFSDPRLLAECLAVINRALQRVRNDPQVSLFAIDDQGHIFIHQASYEAIRKLREHLHRAHSSGLPHEAQFGREGGEETESAPQPEYAFGDRPAHDAQ
jgi:hypothetical protein